MPHKKQKAPPKQFTELQTSLLSGTCHRVSTLDVLVRAGYSKTLARRLLREGKVYTAYGWQPAKESFLLDFMDGELDWMALVVQEKPGYPGWGWSSRVISLRARKPVLLDKLRCWLCRHVLDREWVLPPLGGL